VEKRATSSHICNAIKRGEGRGQLEKGGDKVAASKVIFLNYILFFLIKQFKENKNKQ